MLIHSVVRVRQSSDDVIALEEFEDEGILFQATSLIGKNANNLT